jgi:hypothetical protein
VIAIRFPPGCFDSRIVMVARGVRTDVRTDVGTVIVCVRCDVRPSLGWVDSLTIPLKRNYVATLSANKTVPGTQPPPRHTRARVPMPALGR